MGRRLIRLARVLVNLPKTWGIPSTRCGIRWLPGAISRLWSGAWRFPRRPPV